MRKFLTVIAALLVGAACCAADIVRSDDIVRVDGSAYYRHTVAQGQTLYSIAKAYDVKVSDILECNDTDGTIGIGDVILVPIAAVNNLKDEGFMSGLALYTKHKVAKGETLYSISRMYGIPQEEILSDNPQLDYRALKVGSRINIRKSSIGKDDLPAGATPAVAETSVPEAAGTHVVLPGETVYSISRRFEVPIQDIMAANGMDDFTVKAGDRITIPGLTEPDTTEQESVDVPDATDLASAVEYAASAVRPAAGGPVQAALMLPLSGSSRTRNNFFEFYQGALLALEDLKAAGISVRLHVFDTRDSADAVREIVEGGALDGMNVIFGPVYERNMQPVAELAARSGIALVSPLSALEQITGPNVFQLSPSNASRNDKLAELFTPDCHVVFISAGHPDQTMYDEIIGLVKGTSEVVSYREGLSLDSHLKPGRTNLFVVTSATETDTDVTLAAISSTNNNRQARSMSEAPVSVIGNSRWLRYPNVETNLFFKLGVAMTTTYHADLTDAAYSQFDRRYTSAFGGFPTLYSYRGYDSFRLFIAALSEHDGSAEFSEVVNRQPVPLRVPYRFVMSGGRYVNDQWAMLQYGNDYSITIK